MRVCVCVNFWDNLVRWQISGNISIFTNCFPCLMYESNNISKERHPKNKLTRFLIKESIKAFTTCYQATMAVCVVYSQRKTTCFMCLSYSSFMLPSVWQGEGGFLWTNLSILNPPLRKNKCIAIQVSFLQVSTHQPHFSSVFKYFSSSSSTAFLMKWSSDVLLVLTHCTTSHFWKSMFLLSIKKVHVYIIDDSMCHS